MVHESPTRKNVVGWYEGPMAPFIILLPEIFLNIPEMGFVLFMLMGGNKGILPPFFDTDPWLGDNPKDEMLPPYSQPA